MSTWNDEQKLRGLGGPARVASYPCGDDVCVPIEEHRAEVERMRTGWDADVDWANKLLRERDAYRDLAHELAQALSQAVDARYRVHPFPRNTGSVLSKARRWGLT